MEDRSAREDLPADLDSRLIPPSAWPTKSASNRPTASFTPSSAWTGIPTASAIPRTRHQQIRADLLGRSAEYSASKSSSACGQNTARKPCSARATATAKPRWWVARMALISCCWIYLAVIRFRSEIRTVGKDGIGAPSTSGAWSRSACSSRTMPTSSPTS